MKMNVSALLHFHKSQGRQLKHHCCTMRLHNKKHIDFSSLCHLEIDKQTQNLMSTRTGKVYKSFQTVRC